MAINADVHVSGGSITGQNGSGIDSYSDSTSPNTIVISEGSITADTTVNAAWKEVVQPKTEPEKTVITDLAKVKGFKLKKGKGSFTAKWKKPAKKVKKTYGGYQIEYSMNKDFSDAAMVTAVWTYRERSTVTISCT